MTFFDIASARALFDGMELESFVEEENDDRGWDEMKHWHVFHAIARPMRVVLQRVLRASVTVDGERVSEIGRGYLLLVGVGRGDPSDEPERLAEKIVHLRLFADEEGKTNLPIAGVDGEILVVSQFTLYADLRKGRRPSWGDAEDPEIAAAPRRGVGRSARGPRRACVARGVRRGDGRRAAERRSVHAGARGIVAQPGVGCSFRSLGSTAQACSPSRRPSEPRLRATHR